MLAFDESPWKDFYENTPLTIEAKYGIIYGVFKRGYRTMAIDRNILICKC